MRNATVEEVEAFVSRYSNWVRWCCAKGLHQGHAFSVEGNYRSPQVWYPEPARAGSIDVPDAVLLNQAYTRLALLSPRQARIIKILTFRAYLRPQWQAQKLNCHYLELSELLYNARVALLNQVCILERIRHNAFRFRMIVHG